MTTLGGANITIARKSGSAALIKRVLGLTNLAAYVGVPAASSKKRSEQLLGMAAKTTSKKKRAYLTKAAESDINNAELLFVFSKGSPKRHQPARPVIEPAIAAEGNKQAIAHEIGASLKASLDGDKEKALKKMQRAALAGQNAARGWFTSGKTGWQDLAESTKKAKARRLTSAQRKKGLDADGNLAPGSYTIGIDTGAMRASIVGIVAEE